MRKAKFEWDPKKDQLNLEKHGVDFYDAEQAFLDKRRIMQKISIMVIVKNDSFALGKYLVV